MVEAVIMNFRLWLISIALAALPSIAFGHVLDEYLQSTLIAIEPGDIRLKINLTPGIEIAEKILSQIDHDNDGAISSSESTVYAEMVKRDLIVRLNGRETQLRLTTCNIPELAELLTGQGIIQMEFSLTSCFFSGGNHRLEFENRHFNWLGVYLVNAARPESAAIRIVRQLRNENQSRGTIEFDYAVPNSFPFRSMGFLASIALVVGGILVAIRRPMRSSTNVRGSLS